VAIASGKSGPVMYACLSQSRLIATPQRRAQQARGRSVVFFQGKGPVRQPRRAMSPSWLSVFQTRSQKGKHSLGYQTNP